MSGWDWVWAGWLALFGLFEGIAFARADGGTFSERVWFWFRVRDSRPTALTWVLRVPLYAFVVWLAGHLAFGWWSA